MTLSMSAAGPARAKKTFSGCWTCRQRHVRCDEGRPCCSRCNKGGFACRGYGIRLVWIDPATNEWERKIRRVVGEPTPYNDTSPSMQVDVPKALDQLDQDVNQHDHQSAESLSGALMSHTANFEEEEEDTTTLQPRIARRTSVDAGSTTVHRHLDLLPRPAEQRELIHHWVSFVSWHMVPVDGPDNPFRTVLTPMALEGLNTPSQESNGRVALLHALCATSAFSRGQFLDDDKLLTLAKKHYHLAILHLRHTLASLAKSDLDAQRDSVIATITMFSVMDMITGRSSEWRTHVEGGASLLPISEGSIWNGGKSSSMIYQCYLAVAALCNIELPETIDVESGECKHYMLDTFFGLTRPIFQNIVKLNSLLKRTLVADIAPDVLNELENETRANPPDDADFEGLIDPRKRQLAHHHAFVFHYGSLINFERTVRGTSPCALQDLVAQAIDHFEDIERLGADTVGCTLIWPPFVVACECLRADLQDRMMNWYKSKRRHGFMNLEISKDVAQEVWRRRDEAPKGIDIRWQDVVADLKIDIVLA
ncbi:arginine metabolism regulation protein II [Exophiala xenobiotica]|nr:arginine metabolism regulation protein II [Exophiala xenobiotica]KAK5273783.1 arginine metabolism regulation protein II [Exophiala xenobiotica]KAK5337999.1 arginine metabolism regulation protein II [Exophiala xenobiotica]KAK5499925.1 arginine metabolism regulation protein II [Exophiala xenobiotica]